MAEEDTQKKPFYKRWWFIALVIIFIFAAIVGGEVETENETTETDTEEVTETEEGVETEEDTEAPEDDIELTQDMFSEVESFMEEETLVRDAHVGLYEDDTQIRITIQVNASTNEEHSESLADSAVRYLSSIVSRNNESLDSPSSDYLGGLYDRYDLRVGVGTDADNFIYQGRKETSHDSLR